MKITKIKTYKFLNPSFDDHIHCFFKEFFYELKIRKNFVKTQNIQMFSLYLNLYVILINIKILIIILKNKSRIYISLNYYIIQYYHFN